MWGCSHLSVLSRSVPLSGHSSLNRSFSALCKGSNHSILSQIRYFMYSWLHSPKMGGEEGKRSVYHLSPKNISAQKIDFQPFLTPKLNFNFKFLIKCIDIDLFYFFNLQKPKLQVGSKKHHVPNMMFENIIFLELIVENIIFFGNFANIMFEKRWCSKLIVRAWGWCELLI